MAVHSTGGKFMTKTKAMAGIALLGLLVGVSATAQAYDLVTNGGFEDNTGNGQVGFNTTVTGWSVPDPNAGNSYTFLFAPGTADTTGAIGQYGGLSLWGPGNGSANGLPATSPDGGYFIAQDSAFQQGAISQTINGLVAGQMYNVSFYWAAAQQYGFNGSTYDAWQVSLGGQTQTTSTVNLDSHGFQPWMHESFTFTADNSSDVLSFLAVGGPGGVPPFALLDGVSVNAVPESRYSLGILVCLAGGTIALRHRHARAKKSAS
jgi:hypothetical protein